MKQYSGLKQNRRSEDDLSEADLRLLPADYAAAEDYYKLHRFPKITVETSFRSALFSVLASQQDYANHIKGYAALLANGYDNPEKLAREKNSLLLRVIASGLHAQNQKRTYLQDIADWWMTSDLPSQLVKDATNGQHKEFELRDKIAEEAPGIAWKGASMMLGHLGYERVVPIDVWMMRVVRSTGLTDAVIPNYRTESGPRGDPYRRCENHITMLSEQYKLSPFKTQVALWVKLTGWTPASYLDPQKFKEYAEATQRIWTFEELEKHLPEKGIRESFNHFKKNRTPEELRSLLRLWGEEIIPRDSRRTEQTPKIEKDPDLEQRTLF